MQVEDSNRGKRFWVRVSPTASKTSAQDSLKVPEVSVSCRSLQLERGGLPLGRSMAYALACHPIS